MNLPGFVAEASLYHSSGSYRSVAARSNSSGEHKVVAQRIAHDGGCYAALSSCWSACTVWPEGILRYYCQEGCLTTFDACTVPPVGLAL
jgi:hypothetical protein